MKVYFVWSNWCFERVTYLSGMTVWRIGPLRIIEGARR